MFSACDSTVDKLAVKALAVMLDAPPTIVDANWFAASPVNPISRIVVFVE